MHESASTSSEADVEPQEVHEDPVLRQRLTFRPAIEDGCEVLLVEFWVDPGGGVPPHVHPAMEERFEVLEGRPSFLAGRKWETAGPGESVTVPPGTRHAYKNEGDETAHVICHARPPSSLQGFLEDAAALGRAGRLTSRAMPKSFDALLQSAVMVEHYKDMVTLGFPLPPRPLQRVLMPPLAWLGRRRGYRAGHITEKVTA